MPKLLNSVPKYRRHKASGQAIVTLQGKDFYLGPHGSQVSKVEYDRLTAEWLTNGRRLPHLRAAYALWLYSLQCARQIFNPGELSPLAAQILEIVISHGSLTRTELSNALSRRRTSSEIETALNELIEAGEIEIKSERTDGRDKQVIQLKSELSE